MKIGEERKLLVHNLTASFSGSLAAPFLTIFYYEVAKQSFFLTGLVNYAPALLSVFMGLIWARISDTNGKRKTFVVIASATGIATTMAMSYVENVDQLLMIRLAGAITGSAGGAAFSALFAKTFKKNRGSSLGKYDAMGIIGSFVGSLTSGYLYSTIGFRTMLRIIALLNLVPLGIIISIKEEPEPRHKLDLKHLVEIPKIPKKFWRVYASRLLITLPGSIGGSIIGIYFIKYLGGTPELWSIVAAATTLTGLSSTFYGKLADRMSVRQMFTLAGLGWTALYTGYFLAQDPIVFAAILVIPVWPAFWVAYRKALMDISDQTERATFFAVESLLTSIYGSVLGITTSYVADLINPRMLFLVSAIAAISSTIAVQKLLSFEKGLDIKKPSFEVHVNLEPIIEPISKIKGKMISH